MRAIDLIGVPSSAGARNQGQELAPAWLREAGLIQALETAGRPVQDRGDLPRFVYSPDEAHPTQQNLESVTTVARRVADEVGRVGRDGRALLILGGDCTITLGVVAGLVRRIDDLGLLYLDGDVDLHTPADTPSGIFDGMVLAHLIGQGTPTLARLGARHPLLPPNRIVPFGYNTEAGWIEPDELLRLDERFPVKYAATAVRARPEQATTEALSHLAPACDRVLVHFDVDVIDEDEFPPADVPHAHGLTFEDVVRVLRILVASPQFAGLVVTEFNAARDPDGVHAARLVHTLTEALRAARPTASH